jgi:hypothetical protein
MSATRPPTFDDRFATPVEASRRGAHRARPKPISAGLPVLAGIAVVLLVVGGVYFVFLRGHGGSPSSNNMAAAPTSTMPAATSGAGAAGATAGPTGMGGATSTSASAGTGTGVNHSVSLAVLNSVPVQGLAKRVKTKLAPNGWTVTRTGNSNSKNLPATKIYYGQPALKSTAQALAQDLGYGQLVRDPAVATTGLVVVLGQDASG